MADGVSITPGTGVTVGSDEIAGKQYQRVKLIHGADGVNDGDVSGANGLPVDVLSLPSGLATAANQATEIGSLATIAAATAAAATVLVSGVATITFDAPQHVVVDSATLGTVAVSGPLTDAQLRATPVPISGNIAFTAPQHVIVDSGTTAVTNAGTFAVQSDLTKIAGGNISVNSGNKDAGTQRVVIASDQPNVPISGTVKTSYGTATTFTKANANIASSVTAGWKSNAIDNTSTKALDAIIGIELAAVNSAPAGTKTLYVYAYGLIEGTAYSSTGDGTIDGSEGAVTFPSVTTLPVALRLIGTIPYPVQNKAINSLFRWCGGQNDMPCLPDKWGIAIINDTGMTLNVTNIYYQELFSTVGA